MLKIALVVEHDQLRKPAGAMRTPHLVALSEALARAGHEVTVLVQRGEESRPVEEAGVRVLRYGHDLTAALRSCRPDVVHAHCGAEGLAASAVARALDVPFVFTLHASTAAPAAAALSGADRVLATFSAQVPSLLAAGVRRQDISVVPYGVDVDHFNPDGDRVDKRLAQRVVAVGDVAPRSGFGTAIAALPAVPDAELVLVGDIGSGAHATELSDYARTFGVADRLHLAGPVPRTDLPKLLRSADLMVCSPRKAIFGTAALEAMACGIAVVANGTGGLADTVVHDVTGTHVAPRKPRELAVALQRTLFRRAIREQQGAAGRDRAAARYSWDRVATETTHAYRLAGAIDPAVQAKEAAAARRRNTRVTSQA
jgi:glycosyltransferase involved in cell wall biosynthesis